MTENKPPNKAVKRPEDNARPRNGLFVSGGFPYMFTLIVAFISFQYNQITDQIKDSPYMQYRTGLDSTRQAKTGDTSFYTCTVENISKSRFKSLQFVFTFKPQQLRYRKFLFPYVEPVHPAALHGFKDTLAADQIAAIFTVSNFQPETSYKFHFLVLHPSGNLQDPYMYINSEENVILKSPSLFTWCISNQLLLNGVILLFLFLVLAIYFVYLNRIRYEDKSA